MQYDVKCRVFRLHNALSYAGRLLSNPREVSVTIKESTMQVLIQNSPPTIVHQVTQRLHNKRSNTQQYQKPTDL